MTIQDDLRYPIGRFHAPPSSNADERAAQIETLRRLPERLRAAVDPLDDRQLETPYREGGWTVRQLVHHIADSHANSYVRFKLALTEDWPTIKPYDEAAWAELPDCRALPVETSLKWIEAMHARWVAVLESISESDFQKGFKHPEIGPQKLATSLAMYVPPPHRAHHKAESADGVVSGCFFLLSLRC